MIETISNLWVRLIHVLPAQIQVKNVTKVLNVRPELKRDRPPVNVRVKADVPRPKEAVLVRAKPHVVTKIVKIL